MALDDLKKLHQKKYRYELGYFLVEGEHLISELERAAENNPALLASELFITDRYQGYSSPLRRHEISEKRMKQLSDTQAPQGIVACVPMSAVQSLSESASHERAVYLYEIQDPGNLGTILRTMAWFGRSRCLLSPGSVDPFNSKVLRASMGAIFHVPLELDVGIDELMQRYADIACLDMNGASLKSAAFHHSACLAFGNEARGVPQELSTSSQVTHYTIAGCGQIDSLNLASTVNMCLYEINR
ncbi:TrmH family RNA methyltransferase [Pseudohongiella spirulinae]|uniref:TrmH family RNA methyltransferase n=1 Tax=Pseudohongiella spirulinae TaxID=1249552 RepID=UPI000717A71B|nr:RNA methyltransferase [Pseudohongiella spirulinae]